MTTAATIIADALIEIGVQGASDTTPAEDQALCLRKLNQIAQRWSNSRLAVPALTEIGIPMTGAASYSIGPTGAIVAARPIKAISATAIDVNGLEYPVSLYSRRDWDAIGQKNVTGGPPDVAWYQPSTPNGVLYVYPLSTDYTLKLDCLTLLSSFPSASTTVSLPEGYETALTLTLADDVAAAFGKQTTADTRRRCAAAMAAIKATNTEPLYLSVDGGGQDYEIERGY
jgi:hypothetical protein